MPPTPNFRRLHFSLKDRVVSFLSEVLFENMTYTVRHGIIRGMKRKGGMGFLPAALLLKPANQPEEDFLRSLDLAGKVVYDIGAFHGIMTLFFSRHAKAVIAYEPHPENYRRLLENINLNRLENVTTFNRGIGDSESFIELACDPRMPGAASGDPTIQSQIRNSLPDTQTIQIEVLCLDDEVERQKLPLPDLIKIDIEGMELRALRGMKKLLAAQRPQLYLEMHGATEDEKELKAKQILDFLSQMGYSLIRHVETGATITRADFAAVRTGHLFCVAS